MKVPVLSFGASSLGGVFHSVREAEAIRAVFTAIEHGMNFIDVSPYYGHTKAETVLGKALTELQRESFLLSTKSDVTGAGGVDDVDYLQGGLGKAFLKYGTVACGLHRPYQRA